MDERRAQIGDVELCYEPFGDEDHPLVLLVMGLGTQMVAWPEEFCRRIADEGFRVVRFDNRDVGRSTHLRGRRPPSAFELVTRRVRNPPYRLADMAQDAAGLIEHLGQDSAHVVGASMGGMIAQTLAARWPDRVRSLVSIMSSTGGRRVGQPAWQLLPIFLRQAPKERDAFVEHVVSLYGRIGSSPELRGSEEELRRVAALSHDRGIDPAGSGRQLGAILASGDRTQELRAIAAPTLVIHGSADRLVHPSGGRATARAIRGARLLEIAGMGHDLPRGAWDRLVEAIVEHARAADRRAGVSTPA